MNYKYGGEIVIDKRIMNVQIAKELPDDKLTFWFDFKQQKFLHNVDTFYYSVKFVNDFVSDTVDENVKAFRKYFEQKKAALNSQYNESITLHFPEIEQPLNLRPFSFAGFYTICLECPDFFDLFIAPSVPHGSDGGESLTSEWVVQIRSYALWMYGLNGAFEKSYQIIKGLVEHFHLDIYSVQENRVDYCWHSNYLAEPEKFFTPEKFYKMRCDKFKGATFHTAKVGTQDFEIDYVAAGKRSDKVFLRIYLKTKEVVEKGYKPWFFKVWLFHGLINRYDLYVYEECFLKRSWQHRYMARLQFYLEHGADESKKEVIRQLLDNKITMSEDSIIKLADSLTPKVNLIMNVEYQTTRKHSKSYDLLPFKDNSSKGECKRIYDYFDNRKLIVDYLTHDVFRLVEPEGDSNKSRRELVGFWKALRRMKKIDMLIPPEEIKLTRTYNRNLNAQFIKKRIVKSAVTHGIYTKGINNDNPMTDVLDALCILNDNDIQEALRFKKKKISQFNADELTDTLILNPVNNFAVMNNHTGEVYEYSNTCSEDLQE